MSDVRRIFSVQAIRAFLYGFGSILIGASLAATGLTDGEVGIVFTAMLLGMAITSLAVGRWGERIGRRRVYLALLLLMGVAGTVFALTGYVPFLALVALTGTMSTDPNESGPITSVEQAMLAATPSTERARVYAPASTGSAPPGAARRAAARRPRRVRRAERGRCPPPRAAAARPLDPAELSGPRNGDAPCPGRAGHPPRPSSAPPWCSWTWRATPSPRSPRCSTARPGP